MKSKIWYCLLCAALSAAVAYFVAGAVVRNARVNSSDTPASRGMVSRSDDGRPRAAALSEVTSFSDAAALASQTVVYVKVVKKGSARPTSVFDLIFGFPAQSKDEVGLGSGVIIRSDGYIVTNNHVISGADQIEVTLENKRVYPATLVGTDPATDLALLKIEADGLPAIEMGDSDELRVGDWVLAIGSPYDLRSTITAGIVSAKGRSFPNYDGQYRVESFIQTDAAVNPGNSGGALVNTSGQLVGINTSIISLTGSYAGYSFAVPVNIVGKIADDFIQYGEVRRAVLGISMSEITSERASRLSLPEVGGVYVEVVQEGSAADRAGIVSGDILQEINLIPIRDAASLQEQMNKLRPGEKAVITLLREGARKEVVVEL